MDRITLLLANADRRTSNIVETAVLDVCYNQAVVECVRTARVDEFIQQSFLATYDLLIVAADGLPAEPSRRAGWVTVEEDARAVEAIKEHSSTPLLALS